MQKEIPIWLGVGGTPESFARAGTLGLPLMVAIIGGETHRFRPLVDLYRGMGRQAGHSADKLKVGVHAFGYVAADEFYPGYARMVATLGKERGWPPASRAQFNAQLAPRGAYLIGSPRQVTDKIMQHSEALGGISRISFQMDTGNLSNAQLSKSIELIGSEVAPALRLR